MAGAGWGEGTGRVAFTFALAGCPCADDGMELNAGMVRLGWALAYRPGNDPFPRPEHEPQKAEARASGRGMWRGRFVPPWKWRQQ